MVGAPAFERGAERCGDALLVADMRLYLGEAQREDLREAGGPAQHGADGVEARSRLAEDTDEVEGDYVTVVEEPVAGCAAARAQKARVGIEADRPGAETASSGDLADGVVSRVHADALVLPLGGESSVAVGRDSHRLAHALRPRVRGRRDGGAP